MNSDWLDDNDEAPAPRRREKDFAPLPGGRHKAKAAGYKRGLARRNGRPVKPDDIHRRRQKKPPDSGP